MIHESNFRPKTYNLRPSFIQKNKSLIKPILIGYALFCSVAFLVSYTAVRLADGGLKDFFISASASFVEDAIFFFFVGLITFWVSLRDPSRASVEERTLWLFNSHKINDQLVDHIKEQATALAIYSHEHEITVTFEGFNEDRTAIKAFINSKRKFSNLIKDAAPKSFKHTYRAYPDVMYEEGNNGELTGAWLTAGPEGSVRKKLTSGSIRLSNSGLVEEVVIPIDKDGQAEFEHDFWVWYRIGEPFFFIIEQYTGTMAVKVVNKVDAVLVLEREDEGRKNEWLLAKNDDRSSVLVGVKPSRQVPFTLREVR